MEKNRGNFSSNLGFIFAAAGSAVGLGNIWKFPYLAGSSGGGIFILVYLILVAVVGIPMILAETTIGRRGGADAMTSLYNVAKEAGSKNAKAWSLVGLIGAACGTIILTYYAVVGGWVVEYIVKSVTTPLSSLTGDAFGAAITSPGAPIFYTLLFSLATMLIVYGGVEKGIEKATKFMMPALFGMLIIVVIRSVTLPGAVDGLRFLFVPNVQAMNEAGGFGKVLLAALGQVFFSLSLGQGIMITYGSYLKKDADLIKSAAIVPWFDTGVALFAGMAVLPAVFAFGMEPSAGPGLLFATLPQVFDNFGPVVGPLFALIFFVLVLFAALTSSISLLEVATAFMVDKFNWERKKAILTMAGGIFVVSIICSLSLGVWSGATIGGLNFFDALGWLTDKIMMPLGSLLVSIFIGHVWGPKNALKEITNEGKLQFKLFGVWAILMKYVLPVVILVIFITGIAA